MSTHISTLQRVMSTNFAHIICSGTNHPKAHHKKISYKAAVDPPINQGTIDRFWDYFYAIYLLFDDSIRYRWQKMHQLEVESLTLKYDIKEWNHRQKRG